MAQRVFGVSDPLSVKGPDPNDIELTKKLEDSLKPFNVFESESDLRHRMEVLNKICSLFKEWIKKITISKVRGEMLFLKDCRLYANSFRIYPRSQLKSLVVKFARLAHLD